MKNKNNYIKKHQNMDIYETILEKHISDDETLLYGKFYLDLDTDNLNCEEEFLKVKEDTQFIVSFLINIMMIPKDLIEIYFSGSKGFHILIQPQVLGIEPNKDLNHHYKKMAMRCKEYSLNGKLDTRIYDDKRLFRLPNTINRKTGLYKVPLTYELFLNSSYEGLKAYATKPKLVPKKRPYLINKAQEIYQDIIKEESPKSKKEHQGIIYKKGKILPCIEAILIEGVDKGNRNNTSVAIASAILQIGEEPKDVIDIMVDWNTLNNPPLPEAEVIKTVGSAWELVKSGRGYGCSFFKEIGFCQENCPLLTK